MSKPKMNQGRIPVAQKPQKSRISAEDVFGNGTFEIPEHIRADMKAKGLEPRWVNSAEVHRNQGYHKKGWKIYRDTQASPEVFKFGQDPDGIVRRGDCILAYKEKEAAQKHRAYVRQMAGENDNIKTRQAEEMAELADRLGVRTTIDSSDDDEG